MEDVEVTTPGENGWTSARVFGKPGVDIREDVFSVVRQNNWSLRELTRVRATLEEAFVELTQE